MRFLETSEGEEKEKKEGEKGRGRGGKITSLVSIFICLKTRGGGGGEKREIRTPVSFGF